MNADFARLAGRTVVVGSGLAGLVTALSLAPKPVVLITRAGLGAETASARAQGGIAASLGADDDAALHLRDTLAAGDGLCDADAAAAITGRAADAVRELERHGVRFDRDAGGALAFGLEAAHSRRRILHVDGDGSGTGMVRALAEAVRGTPSITVLEDITVRRLLADDHGVAGLICAGPAGAAVLPSRQVVLATGGLGGLYDATTNPTGSFGQGIALAARAGAALADMEFVQFHPTALDSPFRPLPLVSEAVRGEGAVLVNGRCESFLAAVPGAELAPRDIVARAVSAEIAAGGKVFLDARSALGNRFASRFPLIDALCRRAGIDPATQPIPVRPAAHYHMGGVATDLSGRSTVPGLWVVGESACTGLHGANRLASNSLLEAVVMGMQAARDILGAPIPAPAQAPQDAETPDAPDLSAIRPLVSRHLGVLRNAASLQAAMAALLPLAEGRGAASDPAVVALLIAVFAAERTESRGAHARTDFPLTLARGERRVMDLAEALAIAREAACPIARSA
jgi:L-aspartate oxidase